MLLAWLVGLEGCVDMWGRLQALAQTRSGLVGALLLQAVAQINIVCRKLVSSADFEKSHIDMMYCREIIAMMRNRFVLQKEGKE